MSEELMGALLIPTERPPVLLDIKRALLTFDTVELLSPDDREVVEPAALMQIVTGHALAVNVRGAARLGKVRGHDELFSELLADLEPALRDGSVVLRDSRKVTQVGHVWVPEGNAHPKFILDNLVKLALDEATMQKAAFDIGTVDQLRNEDLDELAPPTTGMQPRLYERFNGELPADVAPAVARMAIARLGAAIKCLGSAELNGLFPLSTHRSTIEVIDHMQALATKGVLKQMEGKTEEDSLRRVMRAERIILENSSTDLALTQLSVTQVLQLRSRAWGDALRARTQFLATVRQLSRDAESDQDFDRAVREAIGLYDKKSESARNELTKYMFGVLVPKLANWSASAAGVKVAATLLGLPTTEFMIAAAAVTAELGAIGVEGMSVYRSQAQKSRHHGKALLAPYAAIRK